MTDLSPWRLSPETDAAVEAARHDDSSHMFVGEPIFGEKKLLGHGLLFADIEAEFPATMGVAPAHLVEQPSSPWDSLKRWLRRVRLWGEEPFL